MIRIVAATAVLALSANAASAQRLDYGPQTTKAGDVNIRAQANAAELARAQQATTQQMLQQQSDQAAAASAATSQAAYQAQVQAYNGQLDETARAAAAQQSAYQARVRACQAGDRSACAPSQP